MWMKIELRRKMGDFRLRKVSILFFVIFLFLPAMKSAGTEINYLEQMKNKIEGNNEQKEAAIREYFDSLDSNEVMVMLDQACKANDNESAHLIIGVLKDKWKSSPPFEEIINGILDKTKSRSFRFIMIDALGANKRFINDNDVQGVINTLRLLIDDKQNSPEIRAMTITRLTSLIFLFLEKVVIDNTVRAEYGSQLLTFLQDENESMYVRNVSASGLAEIQDKRSVPVLLEMLQEREQFSKEMQRSIVGALGVLRDKRALLPLAEVMRSTPFRQVYGTAAYSLGLIGTSDIIQPLVESISRFDTGSCKNALKRNEDLLLAIVKGEKDGPLSETIKALGEIKSKKAVDSLVGLWDTSDAIKRKKILSALMKINSPDVDKIFLEFNRIEDNDELKEIINDHINRLQNRDNLMNDNVSK